MIRASDCHILSNFWSRTTASKIAESLSTTASSSQKKYVNIIPVSWLKFCFSGFLFNFVSTLFCKRSLFLPSWLFGLYRWPSWEETEETVNSSSFSRDSLIRKSIYRTIDQDLMQWNVKFVKRRIFSPTDRLSIALRHWVWPGALCPEGRYVLDSAKQLADHRLMHIRWLCRTRFATSDLVSYKSSLNTLSRSD